MRSRLPVSQTTASPSFNYVLQVFFPLSFCLFACIFYWLSVGYFFIVIVGYLDDQSLSRETYFWHTPLFLGQTSLDLDTSTMEETLTHLV